MQVIPSRRSFITGKSVRVVTALLGSSAHGPDESSVCSFPQCLLNGGVTCSSPLAVATSSLASQLLASRARLARDRSMLNRRQKLPPSGCRYSTDLRLPIARLYLNGAVTRRRVHRRSVHCDRHRS